MHSFDTIDFLNKNRIKIYLIIALTWFLLIIAFKVWNNDWKQRLRNWKVIRQSYFLFPLTNKHRTNNPWLVVWSYWYVARIFKSYWSNFTASIVLSCIISFLFLCTLHTHFLTIDTYKYHLLIDSFIFFF